MKDCVYYPLGISIFFHNYFQADISNILILRTCGLVFCFFLEKMKQYQFFFWLYSHVEVKINEKYNAHENIRL